MTVLERNPLSNLVEAATVTIASGESLSDALELPTEGEYALVGIILPTITNAAITFAVSQDGSTYVPLYHATAEYTPLSASTGARASSLALDAMRAWNFIKVRSGTAASPVNQGADRAITLLLREVG